MNKCYKVKVCVINVIIFFCFPFRVLATPYIFLCSFKLTVSEIRRITTSFNATLITSGIILIQINLIFVQLLIICIRHSTSVKETHWNINPKQVQSWREHFIREFVTTLPNWHRSFSPITDTPLRQSQHCCRRYPDIQMSLWLF